ncbi:MAG: DUF4366 domain-containing protein [Oscillospiraceae bacterium]|nr:DUF4366 domain-containing protein [Oscillospiraceae bacterium]
MKIKLAPLLCAAALTLSLALPAGAYYASNEDGANEPGGPMTSISVTTEPVSEPELPSLGGLTPDGNLALIDDILDGSYYSSEEIGEGGKMQFVTVETKSGNVFYLVIDHSTGDVYFLNLVDESDLLALLEDEGCEVECDCKVRCEAGAVNTDCPVCRTDLKGCKGEEAEPTPTPTPAATTEPEDEGGFNAATLLPIALIILLGAAGVYYILKARKKKPDTSGDTDLDDYEFPEDDEEDEAK